jgi:hypothetical protein
MSASDIEELIESDWRRDAKGGNGIGKKEFFDCW